MYSVNLFKLFFLLACYMCCLSEAFAQDRNRNNELQLQYGWRQYARQDLLFSPMVYHGSSLLNTRLTYMRQSKKTYHRLALGLGLYNASAQPGYKYLEWKTLEEANSNATTFVLLDLDYTLLTTFFEKGKVTMRAGAKLENQAGAFFYGYGAQSFFGYTLSTGLSPAWQAVYTLNEKHAIEAGVSLPLVSWLARSPYAVNDDRFIENQSSHRNLRLLANFYRDGSFVMLNKLQKLNWQLAYRMALSERWSASAAYQGEYFRYTLPRKFVAIRNELALGISFHF
jgi:hypothetical protein